MKWISVNDKLPLDGENAFGYDVFYGRIGEVYMCKYSGRLVFVDDDDCHISHWMPFPEPPPEPDDVRMGADHELSTGPL